MKNSLFYALLLSTFATVVVAQQHSTKEQVQPRAMTAVDMLSLPSLSNGRLSPNGKHLLFSQSDVDWKENRRSSQLWLTEIDSGESRQLTHSAKDSREGRWSPDGKYIAFVSERHGDDHNQIYLLPMAGGEAFRLTEHAASTSRIRWSPDSASVYFTSMTPRDKQTKRALKDNTVISSFEDPQRHRILWRVDLEDGKITQVSGSNQSVAHYALSKDGNTLLVSIAPGPLIDQRHDAELYSIDLRTGSREQLSDNGYHERNAMFSPDGSQIAYTATVNANGENYYQRKLFLIDKNAEHRLLTEGFSGEVESHFWAKSGDGIYFVANIGVESHLFHYNLDDNHIEQLSDGQRTIRSWHYSQPLDTHVVRWVTSQSPGDFWQSESEQIAFTPITAVHTRLSEQFQLPQQQLIEWRTSDGQALQALLTLPVEYRQGQRFAMVAQTHGGPRSSDQWGMWSTTDYLPVLAAHGYGVLMVNHRGGTGYGDEFLRDMVGGYFNNAHLDVLSGVDHVIELGLADPDRLIKMGWSAGGHMTNKVITVTDRFKAASSGAGAIEWMSMYGETDAAYLRTWWFGGKPWQQDAPLENYLDDSPLSSLWKVTTPTLIFVGGSDVRVPATQSKILFRGLRDVGVETELYVAPGEPHGFRKPSHRLFKINKELQWFAHHLNREEHIFEEVPKD